MSASAARSVVVLGGGVFGVSAALELRRRGHRVSLVDAGSIPHPDASSTDISKAMRMDYGSDGFYTDLARRSREGWLAWNRAAGEALYHEVGVLFLAGRPFEDGGFEADSYATLCALGVPLQRLDTATLVERFPAWSAGRHADGYFNPHGGYVESGRAVAWLKRRALEAGVELREGARGARLHEEGSRVRGVVLEDDAVVAGDWVVVAAGAWTPFLLPHLEEFMWPMGQPVIHYRPEDAGLFEARRFPVWCADIARTGRYGFPLGRDGLLKFGYHGPGRRHRPGEALEPTAREVADCRGYAERVFPVLAGAPVAGTRLCLYCDTWDGNFLIDRDPQRPGLIVAAGGSGHGFKFAPLLGGIVADVLEGRPGADAAPFAWRDPGERAREQARPSPE